MDKVTWIVVLISVVLVLVFLFGTFLMLYRSRKRLFIEKHHDDIVEENIAVLYSDYLEDVEERDGSFSAFVDRKKKAKKVRGILLDIVLGIVGLIMLAVLACSVAYRFTGGQVYINDTAFYVVETDSMSEKNESNDYLDGHDDQIPARTFILLERLGEDEELVPYTIYAYQDKDGNVIVHRYIETMDDGTYLFRGDKNASPIASDVGVTREQIVGRFTCYQNHALGEAIYFLKSPFGIIVIVGLFGVFVGQSVYSEKLDLLYRKRYESLLPEAKEIYEKYVVIDGDRKRKSLLLDGIDIYPEGSVFYILHGNSELSTGEKVEIVKEEDDTCLCKIISDVGSFKSLPIRVKKANLSSYHPL